MYCRFIYKNVNGNKIIANHHKDKSYVAFPSLKNTQLIVSSISADVIFFVSGRNVITKVCCVDSILAYFLILIDAVASALFFPNGDTSSNTKVQSLSSSSWVRGSLKRVTVIE